MFQRGGRYAAPRPPTLADGWSLERLTPISRLYSANGISTGPDGRIYVAQLSGSQISALDLKTGEIEVISPMGSEIVGPDDLAFDSHGNIFVTEFMDARVSVRSIDGTSRVLRDDVPGANGITFHQGRLFIDECRMGGRVLELGLNGDAPRVLVDNVPMPNALALGPDGMLYFPVIGTNEIWRVHPDGGAAAIVVGDLQNPVAVKFDSQGYIISPQGRSGQVLRIDPRTGERTVLADLDPCLDNLTFVGERLFVSHMSDGRITEVLDGGASREVLAAGLQRPLDLAIGDDGRLYVADNAAFYVLQPGGGLQRIGQMFGVGYPGSVRGVAPVGPRCFAITTRNGELALYWPWEREHQILARGLDQLYGLAAAPGGAIIVAEFGAGRVLSMEHGKTEVLASGLRNPIDVVFAPDGTCLVSEAASGRVVKLSGSGVKTVLDGLQRPHGIAVHGGTLFVIDAGAKELVAYDMKSKVRRTVASDLPVGSPPGVIPKPLRGAPPFAGPMGPFAGLAVDADGTLYLSADAEGSVLALRQNVSASMLSASR